MGGRGEGGKTPAPTGARMLPVGRRSVQEGGADAVDDELYRQRRQHHAEQAREDGVAGDAELAIDPLRSEEDGKTARHHQESDEE